MRHFRFLGLIVVLYALTYLAGPSTAWADVSPVINTTSLPDGKVWWHYSQTLSASGTRPIAWSLVEGSLPSGLDLSEDGVISGTPQRKGKEYFVVEARNDAGYMQRRLRISIESEPITEALTGGGCNAGGLGAVVLMFAVVFLKNLRKMGRL